MKTKLGVNEENAADDVVMTSQLVRALRENIHLSQDKKAFEGIDLEALKDKKFSKILRDFPQICGILQDVLGRLIDTLSDDLPDIISRLPDVLELQGLSPQILENEQKTVSFLKKLAAWFCRQGKFNNALKAYEKVLIFYPDDVETLMKVGDIYQGAECFSDAEEQYNKILEIDPSHIHARIELGNVLWAQGNSDKRKIDKAEEEYLLATMKHHYSVQVFYAFARFLFLEKNNLYAARNYLERAFELDPLHADVLMLRAHLASKLGDFALAEGLHRSLSDEYVQIVQNDLNQRLNDVTPEEGKKLN